jgi:hypothetical protein
MSKPTSAFTPAAVCATATKHPTTDVRFTSPVLVRLTPELHELVRQGAAEEDRGLAEFIRDATIIRLGQLGLVPTLNDVDDDEPS